MGYRGDVVRRCAIRRRIGLLLVACAVQAAAAGQEKDPGGSGVEAEIGIKNLGGQIVVGDVAEWNQKLGGRRAVVGRAVDMRMVNGAVVIKHAKLTADDTIVRAESARKRLEARVAILIADIARTADADAEQITQLKAVLGNAVLRKHMQAEAGGSEFAHDWVDSAWDQVIASDAWMLGQESALTAEQRAALVVAEDARAQRLLDARAHIAVVSLASELRLRRPQVDVLEPLVVDWLRERVVKRSQLLAADVVAELLTVPDVREELHLEQMMRLMRMRSAKRAVVLEDGARGDDLGLGRGRYPDDDFALEICALASYHGWDWEELDVLHGAGEMLGRHIRREKPRSWRNGARNLSRSTVDLADEPLWQAVLERERSARGALNPAPPPAYTNVQAEFMSARTKFLAALFDERLLLSEEQRESFIGRLEKHVEYEYRRSWSGHISLDPQPNWGQLRLDTERRVRPRLAMTKALMDTLNPDQLAELGL